MYSIGIDLGGTSMAVGLVDSEGVIKSRVSALTGLVKTSDEILKDLVVLCNHILSDNNLTYDDIKHIGIGIPGTMNPESGVVEFTSNLNFENVPVYEILKKDIPVPVYIENDANCAALAENTYGAAKGCKSSITITIGTGIGGGIILDNKILNGAFFGGGEVGHHVILTGGRQCNCGRKGCWEAQASATALIHYGRETAIEHNDSEIYKMVNGDLDKINAKTVFDAYDSGDKYAAVIVDKYMNFLAEGLVNMINIIQPGTIALGGGVSARGEALLNPLKEIVSSKIYGIKGLQTKMVLAKLGNDGGIIGAALLGE
ncbi:MAG: ROK family protein [Clostridiales bacterium]|jgi:glucokinase|nr:ROK family protein [Clostridiales bacterium]